MRGEAGVRNALKRLKHAALRHIRFAQAFRLSLKNERDSQCPTTDSHQQRAVPIEIPTLPNTKSARRRRVVPWRTSNIHFP